MAENKTESTQPVKKKSVKKKAALKKTAVKKAAVKKTASGKTGGEDNMLPVVETLVQQMNAEREVRDRQISALIEEVRGGLQDLDARASAQAGRHETEMNGLYRSLQDVFSRIKDDSEASENLNLDIFKSLSDSIMQDHEQTLKEIREQGRLQDKKIEHMARALEQRTLRNRLIAIPGVLIAITGIFYMFYVVSIMESAMTSMSQDMHHIQLAVGEMAGQVKTISRDTTAMNDNMQKLNSNTEQMSRDLNVLTRNVAPAMRGMRDMMPWR